jgi:hypothetical protein
MGVLANHFDLSYPKRVAQTIPERQGMNPEHANSTIRGFSYEELITADGSPTVRLWKPDQPAECMHHLQGALSESVYIYYTAMERALENGFPIRVLSVGTGLGYNEFLAAAFGLKNNISKSGFFLSTFESENFIRQEFTHWLSNTKSEWSHIYDGAATEVARRFDLNIEDIRSYLSDTDIQATLDKSTVLNHKYSVIFFDFFSSKATPELWTPEALEVFLKSACLPTCILASFSSKGDLRRALQGAGFQVEKRAGFFGKRQCTYSIRGIDQI